MKALIALIAQARQAWQARLPRERLMLGAMFAVLVIATLWSLWDWSHRERTRLSRALPAAQAALAAMRDDAAELQRLRRQPLRNPPAAAALAELLQTGARSRGLTLAVRPEAGGVHVNGSVDFDAVLIWLGEAQRDYGLKVQRFSASRTGPNSQIEILLLPASAS